MATASWNGVTGDWLKPSDWTTRIVPGAATDVTVGGATDYTLYISSAVVASSLTLDDSGATILDTGSLTLGGALSVEAGTFKLAAGGTIAAGTISVSGTGRVNLRLGSTVVGGTLSTSGSGGFDWNGGTLSGVTYDGVLDLSTNGGTLYVADGLTVNGVGGVGNGTVNIGGGSYSGTLVFDNTQIFDNATVNLGSGTGGGVGSITDEDTTDAGDQVLTFGPNLIINAMGGTSFISFDQGPGYTSYIADSIVNEGTINLSSESYLYMDPENFTNSGTVAVKGSSDLTINSENFTNSGVLTAFQADIDIAPQSFTNSGTITVNGRAFLGIYSASFTNSGTITVSGNASLEIDPGSFTNSGTISISGGSTLYLDGSATTAGINSFTIANGSTLDFSGTLDNSGETLSITSGNFELSGEIDGGEISASGGGSFTCETGTFSGVTYDGTLDLSTHSANLTITNGLTVKGAGGVGDGIINVGGSYWNGDDLDFIDSQTFDNATINLGSNGLIIQIDSPSVTGGQLTFGAGLVINASGSIACNIGYPEYGGEYGVETIVNEGAINVTAGTLLIDPSIFTNFGTIRVTGGVLELGAEFGFDLGTLKFSNIKGTTLAGGTYFVGTGCSFQIGYSQELTTLRADLTLSGVNSAVQVVVGDTTTLLDNTLTTIGASGALRLLADRNFTSTNAFTDGGLLQLGGGSFQTATLAVGGLGTILGFGTINDLVANTGMIEADGGTLTLEDGATGGASKIDADATLEFGAASAEKVTFNGADATLKLDLPASFTGQLFGPLATGDTIDLVGMTVAGQPLLKHSVLSVATSTDTTLTYHFASAPGGSFSVASDGAGGTDLVYSQTATAQLVQAIASFGGDSPSASSHLPLSQTLDGTQPSLLSAAHS